MSTSDDKAKRGTFRKKRYVALMIFIVTFIIIAAAASGSTKKPPGGSTNSISTVTPSGAGTTSFTMNSSRSTISEQNAISSAQQYLQTAPFSKQGLIGQLDSPYGSGFSVSVATAAVDSLNVNWDAEAVASAKDYLQTSSFSCQGLIQQLSSPDGSEYTEAQAQYAATKVGLCGSGGTTHSTSSHVTVSEQNAVRSAKQYLQTAPFSKQGLIDQLDSPDGSGFSVSNATAAVDSLNVNWDAEAVASAKEYLRTSSFSCEGLIQQLSSPDGSEYTEAQARYGATKVGLC